MKPVVPPAKKPVDNKFNDTDAIPTNNDPNSGNAVAKKPDGKAVVDPKK